MALRIFGKTCATPRVTAGAAKKDKASAAPPAAKPPRKRRLLFLRHAEAAPAPIANEDKQRPLTESGTADAASIARALQRRNGKWQPSLALVSDSVRTRETWAAATLAATTLQSVRTVFVPSLYDAAAGADTLLAALADSLRLYATDDDSTVIVCGHNPGMEAAVSALCGSTTELKKSEVALMKSKTRSWEALLKPEADTKKWALKAKIHGAPPAVASPGDAAPPPPPAPEAASAEPTPSPSAATPLRKKAAKAVEGRIRNTAALRPTDSPAEVAR